MMLKVNLLQYLLQDCDVNIKSLKGYTALHGAIISGSLKTIEKLVRLGADVSTQDNDGDSPLHLIRHAKAEEEVTDQSPQLMKVLYTCAYKVCEILCNHNT